MKTFEHGGLVYGADGRRRDVLDFSANINPLGIPETVRNALEKNLDGIVHYPDPAARRLKAAIAERYSLDVDKIAVFNGAAEFFYTYFNATRPKNVRIDNPTFSEYERAATAAGCHVNDFEDYFASATDVHVVCNPNNPTGRLRSIEEIINLTASATTVIVDESFIDFVGDDRSVKRFVNKKNNLIVVQSLTKIFAIPGLRLGFAVAAPDVIERLERSKDVWNVNYLAQVAGRVALQDQNYLERTRRWIKTERRYVFKRLRAIKGLRVFEPAANFVLIEFETAAAANEVVERLNAQNILIRRCDNFRGLDGRHLRMAIRLRAENERVIEIISNGGSD